MKKIIAWFLKDGIEPWHFWHPGSGLIGGVLMGLFICGCYYAYQFIAA